MSIHRLLIVHPDPSDRALILSMLQSLGHRLDEAVHENAAMRLLEQSSFDLVIAAANPADPDCLEFLNYVRRKYPRLPVLLIFTAPNPERLREAVQRGASSVLRFPVPANQLRALVSQALGVPEALPSNGGRPSSPASRSGSDAHPFHGENGTGSASVATRSGSLTESRRPASYGACLTTELRCMIGHDPNVRHTVELAESIAQTRAPILILGEPGTGKSLLAQTIHSRASRGDGPFVEVHCGSLREGVLEVDLFGREGAPREDSGARQGKIARAHGGTLYLKEVSDLSPALQARLVHLMQRGEIEPIGANVPQRVDVRVIVSTSQNLSALVEKGLFRQDLYDLLSVISLRLPPLRQRPGDIEALAEHFRARFAREIGKPAVGFTPEAHDTLRRHSWPGNVQELENVVERAVVLNRGSWIEPGHLGLHRPEGVEVRTVTVSPPAASRTPSAATILPLKEALEEPEKKLILQALEALNWNRQETARVLDINRTTLYKKMKKYGLLFDEPIWAN